MGGAVARELRRVIPNMGNSINKCKTLKQVRRLWVKHQEEGMESQRSKTAESLSATKKVIWKYTTW